MRGGRSSPQVNAESTTAASGAHLALSRPSRDKSASGSPTRYPNSSSLHATSRTTDLAYGSRSSLLGLLRHHDPGGLPLGLRGVEEAELDLGRMLREEGEVHAGAVPNGPEGVRPARHDPHG